MYNDQGHGLPAFSLRAWPAGMRPPLHGRTCGVSQSEGWQFMSVVIHPVGTPRNYCDPVNDAIFYGTAVVSGPFLLFVYGNEKSDAFFLLDLPWNED